MTQLEEVVLTVDELEAIRLKGCFCMDQTQSAKAMKVSQSTFQRILSSAHEKIADALVHYKAIKVEGGNVYKENYQMQKFFCKDCNFKLRYPKMIGKIRCRCPRKRK